MQKVVGSTVFSLPATPAAKCLHYIRQYSLSTRGDLVKATGLSQPTVTRAVTALIDANFVLPRTDLAETHGRGRPTIPLEMTSHQALFAGAAIGTTSTYLALFDTKGKTVRDKRVNFNVAELDQSDFLEHLTAEIHKLTAGLERPLVSVGVTTSGRVTEEGIVDAPNLGWHHVNIAGRLKYHFDVPIEVSAAVPAILGSEMQTAPLPVKDSSPAPTLALFADDSIAAAISRGEGVDLIAELPPTRSQLLNPQHLPTEESLDTDGFLNRLRALGHEADTLESALYLTTNPEVRALFDERATQLGNVAAALIEEYRPGTLLIAGSAFTADLRAPKQFLHAARRHQAAQGVALRMIRSHEEVVYSITRAVALDALLRDPLRFA